MTPEITEEDRKKINYLPNNPLHGAHSTISPRALMRAKTGVNFSDKEIEDICAASYKYIKTETRDFMPAFKEQIPSLALQHHKGAIYKYVTEEQYESYYRTGNIQLSPAYAYSDSDILSPGSDPYEGWGITQIRDQYRSYIMLNQVKTNWLIFCSSDCQADDAVMRARYGEIKLTIRDTSKFLRTICELLGGTNTFQYKISYDDRKFLSVDCDRFGKAFHQHAEAEKKHGATPRQYKKIMRRFCDDVGLRSMLIKPISIQSGGYTKNFSLESEVRLGVCLDKRFDTPRATGCNEEIADLIEVDN